MGRVVNGRYEPDESDVSVRVLVPDDFLGIAIGSVSQCRGSVKGLDTDHTPHATTAIRAFLPRAEFDSLVSLLHEAAIPGVKIEREN